MAIDEIEPWDVEVQMSTCDEWEQAASDDVLRLRAVRWASNVLWKRTGRRYGIVEATVRVCPPCTCECVPCQCGPKSLLLISPRHPITEIVSVTSAYTDVDIDPARYKIVNQHWIGLVDETACGWTVDFQSDLIVVFKAGLTPDEEGLTACADLACEKLKEWMGKQCRLPTKENALGGYRRGRNGRRDVILFGIPSVDQFIINCASVPAGMIDPVGALPYTVT